MTAIAFDTLAYSKRLQAAGMSAAQADALADAQRDAFKEVIELNELATKKGIRESEIRLIKFKWVVGAALAQTAILVGVMALFPQP